jgi:hypothetical protein
MFLSCKDYIVLISLKIVFKNNILVRKCGYVFTKTGVLINHNVNCFKSVHFYTVHKYSIG